MKCSVRVGFFLTRPCDEPALWTCESCHQPICPAHSRTVEAATDSSGAVIPGAAVGTRRCVECAAGATAAREPNRTALGPDHHRDDWNRPAPASRHRSTASDYVAADYTADNFSQQDVDAFDQVHDHDRDTGGSDLYDS